MYTYPSRKQPQRALVYIMNSKNKKSIKTSKSEVKSVKENARLFLDERKNANSILDIISSAEVS